MRSVEKVWPPSSIVLATVSASLIAIGLYFILLRPALLPEDLGFMHLSAAQLVVAGPRMEIWLTHDFQVLGGYVLATGALSLTLAATSFREHRWGAAIGVLTGGLASIGWMVVVNFVIDSDFKWALLAVAAAWAISLGMFWFEKGVHPQDNA